MPNISLSVTADTVAWYGAIVATLGVLFNLLQIYRDRGLIKVKTSRGCVFPDTVIDGGVKVIVEAINVGRRAITLKSCFLKLKNGQCFLILKPFNFSFPYELGEGKSISVCFDEEELFDHLREKSTYVIAALYQDTTGKLYSAHLKLKPPNPLPSNENA